MGRLVGLASKRICDCVVQTRVDKTTLATLFKFFDEGGNTPRSASELGRMALETLREVLVTNRLVRPIENTSEALRVLQNYGIRGLNPLGRGLSNQMKNLQLEGLKPEFDKGVYGSLEGEKKDPIMSPEELEYATMLVEKSLKEGKEK
jgi:hypothetical protein